MAATHLFAMSFGAYSNKENNALSNRMDCLSIDETGKKRYSNKGKPHDQQQQRKYKQSHNKNPGNSKFFSENNINQVIDTVAQNCNKQKSAAAKVHQKSRTEWHDSKSNGNNTTRRCNSQFIIKATNADVELSKDTAAHMKQVRESVQVDAALQHHLAMLAYASHHFMIEQQQKAYYMHEQLRCKEVAKWLSTRTESEQQHCVEKMRIPE